MATITSAALAVYYAPKAARAQKAIELQRANETAIMEESRRLRDEGWQRKEEAEARAEEYRLELARWERAFWTLYNSANKMLSRCGSSVGTALSFLDGSHAEPAKKELSKLDTELKDYHLPDAPKAE